MAVDTGIGQRDDLGLPADAKADTTAAEASDPVTDVAEPVDAAAEVSESGPPPGPPYGPWTFASDNDLLAWNVASSPLDDTCTFERVPEAGGSIKVTITSGECNILHVVTGTPVQDRRMYARVRGEPGLSTMLSVKLYSLHGGRWADNGGVSMPGVWHTRTFNMAGPGKPVGYDPAAVDKIGIVFEGGPGVAWIDEIGLEPAPSETTLPTYEFTSDLGDLGVKPNQSVVDVMEVSDTGFVSIKGQIEKNGDFSVGHVSALDLSRATTLRARMRIPQASKLTAFVKVGASWLWFQAPAVSVEDFRDWNDFAWDLRDVPGLELTREWGFVLEAQDGGAHIDFDYIRFDTVPLPTVDAGEDAAADSAASDAADAVSSDAQDEASAPADAN